MSEFLHNGLIALEAAAHELSGGHFRRPVGSRDSDPGKGLADRVHLYAKMSIWEVWGASPRKISKFLPCFLLKWSANCPEQTLLKVLGRNSVNNGPI